MPRRNGRHLVDVARSRLTWRFGPEVIHHEIYHLVDHAVGALAQDDTWACLGMSVADRLNENSLATGQSAGFVSLYSRTSTAEDKAEIFGMLMSDPVVVDYYSSRDLVVRQKVELIRARVQEFCPSCDEGFWAGVRQERMRDPFYSDYAKKVMSKDPVCLVETRGALQATGQELNISRFQKKRLNTTLMALEINLMHMHSTVEGHQPLWTLKVSGGATPQYFAGISGVVIADEAVAPELVRELIQHQHVELPIVLDLIYGQASPGGPHTYFVAVEAFMERNGNN